MSVDDVYEVNVVFSVAGQRAVCTYHYGEVVACTDDIPARSVCAMYEAVFMPVILDALSNEAACQCIYARRIKPTLNIPFLVVESASPGTIASDTIPANACAVISFYTDRFSRSGRGRSYISGVPESLVADGQMSSPLIALLEDYAELFLDPQAPGGAFTGEWSGIVYSPTLGNGRLILAHVVSPSMGSMRSRRHPYGMIS